MIRFLARLLLAVALLTPQFASGLTPAQKVLLLGDRTLQGAELLLAGETSGFATDFTDANEARRVLVRSSGADTYYAQDAFYSNGGTSPKLVTASTGTLVWSPHNQALQSVDPSADFSPTRLTETQNADVAPDGTTTATRYAETAVTNTHFTLSTSYTVIAGATYTFSQSVKAFGAKIFMRLGTSTGFVASGNGYIDVNLTNGTINATGADIVAGTSFITSEGNGWYRAGFSFVAATTSGSLTHAGLPDSGIAGNYLGVITDGFIVHKTQLNRGTVPTAYLATTTAARYGLALDHTTAGVSRGLLVEPAATNLALQGRDFTTGWTFSSATAARTATGPDGIANSASTLTATAADANIRQGITSASSARITSMFVKRRTGTGSVFLSQGELSGVEIISNGGFADGTGWNVSGGWAIAAGVATHTPGGASDMTQTSLTLTAGRLYRIQWTVSGRTAGVAFTGFQGGSNVNGTSVSSNGTFIHYIRSATGNNSFRVNANSAFDGSVDDISVQLVTETEVTVTSSWTRVHTTVATVTNPVVAIRLATSGDEIDVDLFQHEVGTVATSPIPTFAATVTRAADSPFALLSQIPFSATEGSAAVELTTPLAFKLATRDPAAFAFDGATPNERVIMRFDDDTGTAGEPGLTIVDGGATQATVTGTIIAVSTLTKHAGRWAANDAHAAHNETLGTPDTTVTLPTMTHLRMGTNDSGLGQLGAGGYVRKFVYVPRLFTNTELQTRTAP